MNEHHLAGETAPDLAVFCDFENVAIGVRDEGYDDFDIELVLERLLDKGKIVVKKAYCDWERYKSSKKPMHEAGFEMIEIPHVSYSGKNSADIRLVVDALDLCYTKLHLDTFVIVSGDSDFSPLVAKLRENAKTVIGLGVKSSSSDMLMEACDEFIYYDDLVRGKRRRGRGRGRGGKAPATKKDEDKGEEKKPKSKAASPARRAPEKAAEKTGDPEEAFDLLLDTIEALFRERGDNVWGSMVKQTLKRKRPSFDESYYGFRTFTQLLEEMEVRGLVELEKDARSGGYLVQSFKARS